MANRFGMFYEKKTGRSYTSTNFSQEYIPLAHCNSKTPVHVRMYKESRDNLTTLDEALNEQILQEMVLGRGNLP